MKLTEEDLTRAMRAARASLGIPDADVGMYLIVVVAGEVRATVYSCIDGLEDEESKRLLGYELEHIDRRIDAGVAAPKEGAVTS